MSSFVFLVPQYGLGWPQCGFTFEASIHMTEAFKDTCMYMQLHSKPKSDMKIILTKFNWENYLCHTYGK